MKTATLVALLAFAGNACAQAGAAYPVKPIRLVVPYAAGGPVEIVGRIVGHRLTELYNQQVIVDARGGGGGNIGLEIVARAAPDGYTLLMGANGVIAINPSLYKSLPVDTEKDLAPVSLVASSAMIVVVHPSVPAASVKDLIALAKAKPGAINYASSGSGSTAHLATELLKNMARVDMTHIPYKGAGPALTDVMAGQVQAMITAVSTTLPFVKSGKLKALAVSSEKRLALLPDMPTVAETLPGYEVSTWYGVFAPAATPRAIIDNLNATLVKGFATPDAQARLAGLGADAQTSSPQALGQAVRREKAKWAKLVKESGAKVE
jgi:tripartite-type tricarboxylate transporter receptor subunit TctC